MLLRALIYRIATHEAAFGSAGWTPDQVEAYRPAVSLAGAEGKLTQIARRTRTPAPVGLGMPALSQTPAMN